MTELLTRYLNGLPEAARPIITDAIFKVWQLQDLEQLAAQSPDQASFNSGLAHWTPKTWFAPVAVNGLADYLRLSDVQALAAEAKTLDDFKAGLAQLEKGQPALDPLSPAIGNLVRASLEKLLTVAKIN